MNVMLRKVYGFEDLQLGTEASLARTVSAGDIVAFSEITGDRNPVHLDPEFAAGTIFKQPIAHGMLGAGMISATLGTKLAPNLVVIYMAQNLQFRAPVMPGDEVTATVTVTKVDPDRSRVSLDTLVTNQSGTEVIRGDALVMVEPLS